MTHIAQSQTMFWFKKIKGKQNILMYNKNSFRIEFLSLGVQKAMMMVPIPSCDLSLGVQKAMMMVPHNFL